jgi:hypothetical protein
VLELIAGKVHFKNLLGKDKDCFVCSTVCESVASIIFKQHHVKEMSILLQFIHHTRSIIMIIPSLKINQYSHDVAS